MMLLAHLAPQGAMLHWRIMIRCRIIVRRCTATTRATEKRKNQKHSRYKAADVRPERNSARRGLGERQHAVKKLLHEPPADHYDRWHFNRRQQNKNREQDADAHPRIQQHVRAENAGY